MLNFYSRPERLDDKERARTFMHFHDLYREGARREHDPYLQEVGNAQEIIRAISRGTSTPETFKLRAYANTSNKNKINSKIKEKKKYGLRSLSSDGSQTEEDRTDRNQISEGEVHRKTSHQGIKDPFSLIDDNDSIRHSITVLVANEDKIIAEKGVSITRALKVLSDDDEMSIQVIQTAIEGYEDIQEALKTLLESCTSTNQLLSEVISGI